MVLATRYFHSNSRRQADEQRDLVESIAIWTESLRDAVSASSGLEQAVLATEAHCPKNLRQPMQLLVASLRYGSLEDGLRRFADDVAHPTCDFVVAALVTSARHQTKDLVQLLTHLAECARSECHLYLRIWVSRARSRTSIRIINGSVVSFVGGLLLFNPSYLRPFIGFEGVIVLLGIGVLFTIAITWLQRIASVSIPARLLTGRESQL